MIRIRSWLGFANSRVILFASSTVKPFRTVPHIKLHRPNSKFNRNTHSLPNQTLDKVWRHFRFCPFFVPHSLLSSAFNLDNDESSDPLLFLVLLLLLLPSELGRGIQQKRFCPFIKIYIFIQCSQWNNIIFPLAKRKTIDEFPSRHKWHKSEGGGEVLKLL